MSFNNDSTHLTVGTAGGDIENLNMVTFSPTNFKFQSYFKVNVLKYSPMIPNLLGTAFEDGSVKLIDMSIGEVINNFGGFHQGPASGISFSPINKVFMCSVGMDCRVNFFDVSAKKHIKTLMTDSPLTGVSFHNEGQTIALGTANGNIILYDLRYCNAPKAVLKGHSSQINYLEFSKKSNKPLNNSQSKVQDNVSMSMKSNRSFASAANNNTANNIPNNSVGTSVNNSIAYTFQNNFVQNTQNSLLNQPQPLQQQQSQINLNSKLEVKPKNTSINFDLKDSSFKDTNKDYLQTSFDKKRNESFTKDLNTSNQNKMSSSLTPTIIPTMNSNITSFPMPMNVEIEKVRPKVTPLNLRHIEERVDNNEINLNFDDNKIQNLIKNSVETEMFKMKQFIHDEINSLHVDLIRQFEIQHVL